LDVTVAFSLSVRVARRSILLYLPDQQTTSPSSIMKDLRADISMLVSLVREGILFG
jgi:hypothetical protein